MKKNNKRMLVAMLAMAMALSMTACSEEQTDGGSSNEPDSSVSEQVSEPEVSDLEAEDGTSSDAESESETEAESSDPAANNTSSSAADTGSSTASQPAADQSSSQAQQPATSSQTDTSSQTQAQAPTTAQTSNTSSGKGSLANYTVSIQDSSTPAVSVSGKNINGKNGYYFYSEDGDILGYIASSVVSQINRDYKMIQKTDDEQKDWYVEQFNELRGLEGGSGSVTSNSSSSTTSSESSSKEVDIEEYRKEVFRLVNDERKKAGVAECVSDSTAMEYAQIRAEELAEKFSHESPDGSIMEYSHYTFAENIAKGQDTPEEVVSDWMASSGHRAAMLSDYSNYGNCLGVGVYEEDGTFYWVLEFILWDANA